MTSMDEYRWRYRGPAPSLHKGFAEMAAGRCDRWCHRRRFRRAVVALASLLLLGLATGVASWRAAKAEDLLLLDRSRAFLIRQVGGRAIAADHKHSP